MLHVLFYFSDNLHSLGDVVGTPITFPIITNLLLIDLNLLADKIYSLIVTYIRLLFSFQSVYQVFFSSLHLSCLSRLIMLHGASEGMLPRISKSHS